MSKLTDRETAALRMIQREVADRAAARDQMLGVVQKHRANARKFTGELKKDAHYMSRWLASVALVKPTVKALSRELVTLVDEMPVEIEDDLSRGIPQGYDEEVILAQQFRAIGLLCYLKQADNCATYHRLIDERDNLAYGTPTHLSSSDAPPMEVTVKFVR